MTSSRFDTFLFGPVAATPVALLRIAIGLVTALWTIALIGQVDPLLTSMRVPATGPIGWWQPWPEASVTTVVVLVSLLLLSSLMLALGFRTRMAAVAGFLLLLAFRRYNPLAFNGGDLILSVPWLGLALSNAGAYLAVDSLRHGWEAPPLINAFGLRYVQLHMSLGYVLTALLKLTGEHWPSGTALWYALNLEDLARINLPSGLIGGPWLPLATWGTLVIELGIGVGLWYRRTRPWAIVAGILLHLAIWITLEIGFFSLIMLATYLAWVPPSLRIQAFLPAVVARRAQRSRSAELGRETEGLSRAVDAGQGEAIKH